MATSTATRLALKKIHHDANMRETTHGGPGRGQGRKPLYSEKTVKRNVTLLPSQVEAMEKLGEGNLSAGIRKAIDMSTKPTNLMTDDQRALYEAVNGVKLPRQTDNERNEALRLAAVEYDMSKDDRPMTMNNISYMPPRKAIDMTTQTTNSYLITEEYLGDIATKEQAEKMIALLQARGFDVEYGDQATRLRPWDWNDDEAIDFHTAVLEEMANV